MKLYWLTAFLLLLSACIGEPVPLDESKLDVITRGRLEEIYNHDKVWVNICLYEQDMEIVETIRDQSPNILVKANHTRTGKGWPCYLVQTQVAPQKLNNLSQLDVRRIVVTYHIGDEPVYSIDKFKGTLLGTVWYWPEEEIVSISVKVASFLTTKEIEKLSGLGLDIYPQTWQAEGQQSRVGHYRADLQVGTALDIAAQDIIISMERY